MAYSDATLPIPPRNDGWNFYRCLNALPAQVALDEEDMQKHIALEINKLMLEFSKKLNDSLLLMQDSGDLDDFEKYRENVSKLMTIMYLDIMKPIHLSYPDLEPPGLR